MLPQVEQKPYVVNVTLLSPTTFDSLLMPTTQTKNLVIFRRCAIQVMLWASAVQMVMNRDYIQLLCASAVYDWAKD